MKIFEKKLSWLALLLICFQSFGSFSVAAANLGDVVINEVAWAGSADGSNDEWIELYNASNQSVDLSGWSILDDGSGEYKIVSGIVAPHAYFLIEDSEETVSSKADAVIGLSLANAGDSLVLRDSGGIIVDEVNKSGGAWYAGDAVSKASMERVSPDEDGNDAANWKTAVSGNGAKSRNGLDIVGTPGSVNSNYGGEGVSVFVSPSEFAVSAGGFVDVEIKAEYANDLYAYGIEIVYPKEILSFVSAQEGELLKIDGKSTTFYSGLKDNSEGTLLIGAARLVNPANGVDGSGTLAKIKFKVVSPESDSGGIIIGASSFLADSMGDVAAKFSGADVNVNESESVNFSIANLKVENGEERYSLKISWQEDLDGASTYIVKKKLANGEFVNLGETANPDFVDGDEIAVGGKIIPGVNYLYQIIAVKNGVQSKPFEISGKDERGILGDNDRNDIVNGKDIEKLARSFGSEFNDEEYDSLKDTNFDGVIDGSDLIDIGMNFGLSYKP